MNTLVVFHDHGTHPLSPLLKKGFKHVFAAVKRSGYWLLIDGADGRPQIDVLSNDDWDAAAYYREQGYTVIECEQGDQAIRSPYVTANCVGLVKAHLGIRSWALTPWQLYKHLRGIA